MEEIGKVLWAIPCADHAIFMDADGYLSERYGMASVMGKYGEDVAFIDDNGLTAEPYGNMPSDSIIGRRGETIPISRLSEVFAYSPDLEFVFSILEELGLNIDVASMKQTLEVHFTREVEKEKPVYRMGINMKGGETVFANLICNFIYMDNPDCVGIKYMNDRNLDPRRLDCSIIQFLYEYSCYRDALVDVEIYFDKRSYYGADDDDVTAYNKIVYAEEEKYLGKLRKYVKDKLNEMWAFHKDEATRIEEYRKAKLQVASKYDKDPNLIE